MKDKAGPDTWILSGQIPRKSSTPAIYSGRGMIEVEISLRGSFLVADAFNRSNQCVKDVVFSFINPPITVANQRNPHDLKPHDEMTLIFPLVMEKGALEKGKHDQVSPSGSFHELKLFIAFEDATGDACVDLQVHHVHLSPIQDECGRNPVNRWDFSLKENWTILHLMDEHHLQFSSMKEALLHVTEFLAPHPHSFSVNSSNHRDGKRGIGEKEGPCFGNISPPFMVEIHPSTGKTCLYCESGSLGREIEESFIFGNHHVSQESPSFQATSFFDLGQEMNEINNALNLVSVSTGRDLQELKVYLVRLVSMSRARSIIQEDPKINAEMGAFTQFLCSSLESREVLDEDTTNFLLDKLDCIQALVRARISKRPSIDTIQCETPLFYEEQHEHPHGGNEK